MVKFYEDQIVFFPMLIFREMEHFQAEQIQSPDKGCPASSVSS